MRTAAATERMADPLMTMPASLLATTRAERGAPGLAWLRRVPAIVRRCAEAWSLEVAPPYAGLSYNYVAPARRADGSAAVLKVSFPEPESSAEVAALRAFEGGTCVRLLAADADVCALLLRRLEPGAPLASLGDDVAETAAAAAVMRGLWRPPPAAHGFPLAGDWLAAASEPAPLAATKAAHPWVARALALAGEVASDGAPQLLLHGDLHHDNILSAGRAPWLAIDPKGVVGEPAWELAPFLFNHLPADEGDARRLVRRRADQLADELALDRARVYAWSAVRSLQAAYWSLRDAAPPWGRAMLCGEELARGP